jgi:hypothetical protein
MDGWMERCMYFYMIVWMDEWTIGTTDRWMSGKEERKKVWRKECILEMMGTLWHSCRTADLPFSFHVTI